MCPTRPTFRYAFLPKCANLTSQYCTVFLASQSSWIYTHWSVIRQGATGQEPLWVLPCGPTVLLFKSWVPCRVLKLVIEQQASFCTWYVPQSTRPSENLFLQAFVWDCLLDFTYISINYPFSEAACNCILWIKGQSLAWNYFDLLVYWSWPRILLFASLHLESQFDSLCPFILKVSLTSNLAIE